MGFDQQPNPLWGIGYFTALVFRGQKSERSSLTACAHHPSTSIFAAQNTQRSHGATTPP
jgi:hypothetical protein